MSDYPEPYLQNEINSREMLGVPLRENIKGVEEENDENQFREDTNRI